MLIIPAGTDLPSPAVDLELGLALVGFSLGVLEGGLNFAYVSKGHGMTSNIDLGREIVWIPCHIY